MSYTEELGQRAKAVESAVAAASTTQKNKALAAISAALIANTELIIAENAKDMAAAKENGISESLQDRLRLDESRIAGIAKGVDELIALRDGHLAAGVAVEGGNAVTPPELTGDAPVKDVVHPVEVVLGEALGNEADVALLHRLDGGLGQGLHANARTTEPQTIAYACSSGIFTVTLRQSSFSPRLMASMR